MGFKEWIIPQDRAFYDLLERHIAISGETVAEFRSMQANWTNVEAWRSKIKELENEADAVGHETFDRLNRTFITPIDREDIARLAHAIDDIADAVYAATNRIALYGIPGPTAPMKEFTDILEAQVKELAAAMTKLRKSGSMAKTVPPHVVEVHRLENLADRALNRAEAELFKGKDAIEILKYKEIYEILEGGTDRCEDVADVLSDVIRKHG